MTFLANCETQIMTYMNVTSQNELDTGQPLQSLAMLVKSYNRTYPMST